MQLLGGTGVICKSNSNPSKLSHSCTWDLDCADPALADTALCAAPALTPIPTPGAPPAPQWNLEFADPGLEESYRTWFNTMQTATGGWVGGWMGEC